MTEQIRNEDEVFIAGVGAPRLRRVVIEERQEKTLEHARLAAGYAEDVRPNAHDQATFRLINRRKAFDQLPASEYVMPVLDDWDYWTKMNDWDSRNRVLEDLTSKMRRREATGPEIYVLTTVCRPAWKKVAHSLRRTAGIDLDIRADGVEQIEAARRANELDREELDAVVHGACFDLLCSVPNPFPRRFFGWLMDELSRAALKHLRAELTTDGRPLSVDYDIAHELDAVLSKGGGRDTECFESPRGSRHSEWIRTLDVASIFELADEYATYLKRETAVSRAVDRLAPRQRQVIQRHYYEKITEAQIARDRGVASSTIRNSRMQALGNLERDDEMFLVLEAIGDVRDAERRDRLLAEQTQRQFAA